MQSAHSETSPRLWAIAAARLRSEGLNQIQIADRLGKSQPEVSRLLAYAEEHRFLARSPTFLHQNVGAEELKEVDRLFFAPEKLRASLVRLAPPGLHLRVQVLPAEDGPFTSAAAGRVARLLGRAQVVGVMWGRTIRRLVSWIGEHREVFDQRGGKQPQCIPLCGDPVHLMNLQIANNSASQLAAMLGSAIDPERASQPCLVGVPAYFSRRLFSQPGGAASRWEDFVREIPGYRAIFGPSSNEVPWVDRVDTIISGMGIIVPKGSKENRRPAAEATAAYDETGDFISERLKQEEAISESTLARLIYGDMGGWLIERHGLRAEERRLVESLNQGWTGVKGDHFGRVARRAKADGNPGVILVVAGAAKAEMLKEMVKRGYVNELLIDSTLATALDSK